MIICTIYVETTDLETEKPEEQETLQPIQDGTSLMYQQDIYEKIDAYQSGYKGTLHLVQQNKAIQVFFVSFNDIPLNRCDHVTKLSRRYLGVGDDATILAVWQWRSISNNERLLKCNCRIVFNLNRDAWDGERFMF